MNASIGLCVDPAKVHEVWPHVAADIRNAMDRGGMGSFDDVERDVLNANGLLWIAWNAPQIEAAAVTKIDTSNGKACEIVACGGRHSEHWLHILQQIEEFASNEGCDVVRILGRKGWQRVLKDYRVKKVVLEKKIWKH